MLSKTRLDPLEIVLNVLQNDFGSLLTEVFYEPLLWVLVALAEVARLTRRNDVVRSVSAILRDWHPVFFMQNWIEVKQRRRIAAVSANTVEVVKCSIPVVWRKRCWKLSLAGSIAINLSTILGKIIMPPSGSNGLLMIGIGNAPILDHSLDFFGMTLGISLVVSAFALTIILRPLFSSLSSWLWISALSSFDILIVTKLARVANAICAAFIFAEKLWGCGVQITALVAAFLRYTVVAHGWFLPVSHSPAVVTSAGSFVSPIIARKAV